MNRMHKYVIFCLHSASLLVIFKSCVIFFTALQRENPITFVDFVILMYSCNIFRVLHAAGIISYVQQKYLEATNGTVPIRCVDSFLFCVCPLHQAWSDILKKSELWTRFLKNLYKMTFQGSRRWSTVSWNYFPKIYLRIRTPPAPLPRVRD